MYLFSRWSKHFSDAIESLHRREGKSKREAFDDDSDSERVEDLPPANEVAPERAEAVGGDVTSTSSKDSRTTSTTTASSTADAASITVDNIDASSSTKEDQDKQQLQTVEEGRCKSDHLDEGSRNSSTESPGKGKQTYLLIFSFK